MVVLYFYCYSICKQYNFSINGLLMIHATPFNEQLNSHGSEKISRKFSTLTSSTPAGSPSATSTLGRRTST